MANGGNETPYTPYIPPPPHFLHGGAVALNSVALVQSNNTLALN